MTEFYESGGRVSPAEWRGFEDVLARSIGASPPGSVVAVSGSFPAGVRAGAAARLVRFAHRAGRRIVVDTSGPSLVAALTARPDLVKVNAAEAGAALGRPIDTEADALAAAVELARRGASVAIVTRGALGAVAWDGQRGWAVDPPSVDGSHAVGSGDAFLAGLAYGTLRNEPFERCLGRAAGAAGASLLEPGPGNLRRRAAEQLGRAATVRRIP
jgi:fructose-1-phosphate kinase PfkB-like protein